MRTVGVSQKNGKGEWVDADNGDMMNESADDDDEICRKRSRENLVLCTLD